VKNLVFKITLLAGLSMLWLLSGCSIKKPEAPSWRTSWDLPLVNKTYGMQDILDQIDDSLINQDSLGNPYFRIDRDVDTIRVGDNLRIDSASNRDIEYLGPLDLNLPSNQEIILNKSSFGLPGGVGWIPAASFEVYRNLPALDKFSWVLISEGAMSLEVSNDLGIDLDTLIATLYNSGDLAHPLGSADFDGGIDQGQTLNRSIELSGDSLTNQLTLLLHGAVPTSFVTSDSGDLSTTSSFPTHLTVAAAQAEVPSVIRNMDQTISMSDSSFITRAVIDSGFVDLQITNSIDLPADVSFKLPNFTNDSETLTVSEHLDGPGTLNRQINLAGYVFQPTGAERPQTIQILSTASIDSSAPAQRVFKSSDSLYIEVYVSNVTLASITGQVKPTTIAVDSIESDIDVPEGIAEAQLTHAFLNLTLYNNSQADADVNLSMWDENRVRHIGLAGRISGKNNPADPPRATVLTLGSDSLAAFLNPAPSQITITGQAVFNPDTEIVTITRDDYFCGNIEINSPLAFMLTDTVNIDLEINKTNINQDDLPDLEETFGYGKITATLSNRLPVGAIVSLYISTRGDSTMFTDPDALVLGPYTLERALTDANGFAITPVVSAFEDSLDSQQFLIFDNDRVYIAPRVELLPTDTTGSYVRGSDYIGIRAMARIEVKAGDNIWNKNK